MSRPSTTWTIVIVAALLLLAAIATELRGRLAARETPDWHAFTTSANMTGIYAAAFLPAFIAIFAGSSLNQAKVCTPSEFASVGLLIGQTSDRVYLGEQKPAFELPGFRPRPAVRAGLKEAVRDSGSARGVRRAQPSRIFQ